MAANLRFNLFLSLALATKGPINFAPSHGMKFYRGAIELLHQKEPYAGDPHSLKAYLANLGDRAMTGLWLE